MVACDVVSSRECRAQHCKFPLHGQHMYGGHSGNGCQVYAHICVQFFNLAE